MRRFVLLVAGLAWLSFGALLLASVVVASSGGATQAQARWVIRDLGTLGGKESEPVDINSRGQIVGWAVPKGSGFNHPFLWENGRMRDLGTFGGRAGSALAVNDNGQVVGSAETRSGDGHAFLWENGKLRDLGTLGGAESEASAINERGQVIGWAEDKSGEKRSFLWQDGTMRDLKAFAASAINDLGQIVGTTSKGLALWQNGKIRTLAKLGGDYYWAEALNEHGQIIANTALDVPGDDPVRAFIWQRGKLVSLGMLPRMNSIQGAAINERGEVIGESSGIRGASHGFLWYAGQLHDLGSNAIPSAINDDGQVVGDIYGLTATDVGTTRGYIWQNGRATGLGTIGKLDSSAMDLNARGQVIGTVGEWGRNQHAVLWTKR